ncbi:MAG: serine/threonine-protein kinase, partial [Planctomycetia bacterium]
MEAEAEFGDEPAVFAERLAAIDAAVASGELLDPSIYRDFQSDDRLRRAASCLERLERDRQSRTRQVAPSVDEPTLFSIGRYRAEQRLGGGGFGVVYLAEDVLLRRRVALKIPRADILFTAELKQRFLREIRAAARLDHPHVAALHDSGEEGALCYMVTAYCEGGSLAQWLEKRTEATPTATAVAMTAELANAVQHAHDMGVLHRDLKPANVLLAGPPGEAPHLKIADFGLARFLSGRPDDDGTLTKANEILGTPAYMAPEQARADGVVGEAADIYSLGVLLYELLTGAPPFRGATSLETLRMAAEETPKSPRAVRREISHELEAVCLKCLEKDPERRYASAKLLAEDLRRVLAGEPTAARPSFRHTAAGRCLYRPVTFSTVAVAVAVAVGAIVLASMVVLALQFTDRGNEALSKAAKYETDRRRGYARRLVKSTDQWLGKLPPRDWPLASDLLASPKEADLYGFEWYYLRDQARRNRRLVVKPDKPVRGLGYVDGGRRLTYWWKDGENGVQLAAVDVESGAGAP